MTAGNDKIKSEELFKKSCFKTHEYENYSPLKVPNGPGIHAVQSG